jgi:hypothetical protein
MRRIALLLTAAILGMGAAPVFAQPAKAPPAPAGALPVPHAGELECRNCHESMHQGVVRMYLGLGGRGTPMIPSHMVQVRVQCVACHTVPKTEGSAATLVGQTFRPSEQACVGCHGEKYRGMLQRWTEVLGKMRAIVEPKLAALRSALGSQQTAKTARARKLTDDATFNVQFVALGKGIHNVFYAADLLKTSNGWADEALTLLGKPPAKGDDVLVRGGYCAVLCHETAKVKQLETVTFGKQKLPHVRHVTEFGATCTACHSAEVHKAVTATPTTCASCHHSAQNERCESCHTAQSAFYRGQIKTDLAKVEPNAMASAVGCTGCHDWSRKHSRQAVGEKCVGCHDASYSSFLSEWTTGLDKESAAALAAVKQAESALGRERRAGRKTSGADALARQAREALNLLRKARGVHNPSAAEDLLKTSRRKADEALASLTRSEIPAVRR